MMKHLHPVGYQRAHPEQQSGTSQWRSCRSVCRQLWPHGEGSHQDGGPLPCSAADDTGSDIGGSSCSSLVELQ